MKCLHPFVLAALLAGTSAAWAALSQDEAAAAAQRVAPGRVLSVERADSGGRAAWRVKLLSAQGEVRIVVLDAATGRPLP